MRRILAYILCFYGFANLATRGADVLVQPSGDYQDIDVRLEFDTIQSLGTSKGKTRLQIITAITNKPENFTPPVLYVLSNVLFDEGRKDEAMFWFYAGQLRGTIDANICADKSAKAAIDVLNQNFGPPINQYAFRNISTLTNTVERVISWEEKTPYAYDRRWINLHGMGAFTENTNEPLSVPKEQWEAIRKKTRDEYRSEFYQALAEFKKNKPGQPDQDGRPK